MRINLGNKAYLYPQPVLIIATFDKDNNPDAMNAAWGGVSDYSQLIMCLSHTHKTVDNILENKEFTVSVGVKSKVVECDYLGIVSGHKVKNKLKEANLTYSESKNIHAPIINELPLTFECRLISYDKESELLKAEIINCLADESILTNNKIDPDKLEAISYDGFNHTYLLVKGEVGKAFQEGKKLIK